MKVRMARFANVATLLFVLSMAVVAQQATTPKAKASTPTKPTTKAVVTKKSETPDSSLPTNAVVDSFMKRMFGYNPAVTWKIVDISPSEIPGVARVLVAIGGQP